MIPAPILAAIASQAARLDVEPAALAAIVEVESAGRLFARIDGRDEPLIRFEGHWFDRRLSGVKRNAARAAGLADPKAGAVANPAGQPARWTMLARAMRIDRAAALESVSWGIGQVMGGNWKMLGFASVEELVAEARSGAAGQLRLMTRHIEAAGLLPALRRRDWTAFARGYNGPGYRANAYDRKMAAAYARHRDATLPPPLAPRPSADSIALGARGDAVKTLQRLLTAQGYPVAADGVFGERTRAAVIAFQRANGLSADGVAGAKTLAALGPPATPSLWRRLMDWLTRWLA
ncbi:MAG: DUF3380 domain-containing protein [Phyllobacteriaceae bacterium]|nr:DUF3380 domain-containing protein [Phyllobacteriaceae bacterium]